MKCIYCPLVSPLSSVRESGTLCIILMYATSAHIHVSAKCISLVCFHHNQLQLRSYFTHDEEHLNETEREHQLRMFMSDSSVQTCECVSTHIIINMHVHLLRLRGKQSLTNQHRNGQGTCQDSKLWILARINHVWRARTTTVIKPMIADFQSP